MFNLHAMRRAVLNFLIASNFCILNQWQALFPESLTLLVWDTLTHRVLCELTTPVMPIVVESFQQHFWHMGRCLLKFMEYKMARE